MVLLHAALERGMHMAPASTGDSPPLTNTALSALAAAGQDVLAQKLLRDMPRAQVRRDVISLACLTKAFDRRRLWRQALGSLQQLPQHALDFSAIACSSGASSCNKCSIWSWTLQLLMEHESRTLLVEESTYCCAVHSCGSQSAWPEAMFLIDVMQAGRLRTSDILFQNLPGIFMEPRRART